CCGLHGLDAGARQQRQALMLHVIELLDGFDRRREAVVANRRVSAQRSDGYGAHHQNCQLGFHWINLSFLVLGGRSSRSGTPNEPSSPLSFSRLIGPTILTMVSSLGSR